MQLREGGHVFLFVLTDPWTLEELNLKLSQDAEIRDSAKHTIHAIVDLSGIKEIPIGLMSTHKSPDLTHPTRGYVVVVGATPLLASLSQTIFRVAGFRQYVFKADLEAGLEFLRETIAHGENAMSGRDYA